MDNMRITDALQGIREDAQFARDTRDETSTRVMCEQIIQRVHLIELELKPSVAPLDWREKRDIALKALDSVLESWEKSKQFLEVYGHDACSSEAIDKMNNAMQVVQGVKAVLRD